MMYPLVNESVWLLSALGSGMELLIWTDEEAK